MLKKLGGASLQFLARKPMKARDAQLPDLAAQLLVAPYWEHQTPGMPAGKETGGLSFNK